MQRCAECEQETLQDAIDYRFCPWCGAAAEPEAEAGAWRSIARISHAAEAGYVADMLQQQGMTVRTVQHHEHSALEGGRPLIFVLQVPRDRAAEATRMIRAAIEDDDPADDAAPAAVGMWKPVVLLLLTGGLAYGAIGGWQRPPAVGGPERQDDLWQALTESDAEMHTNGGEPRRSLHFDPGTRTLVLQEDLNGDGRFDRVRQFRDGRLVREAAQ